MGNLQTTLLSYGLGTGHGQVAETLAAELKALGMPANTGPSKNGCPDYDLIFRHGYFFLALKVPAVWGRYVPLLLLCASGGSPFGPGPEGGEAVRERRIRQP